METRKALLAGASGLIGGHLPGRKAQPRAEVLGAGIENGHGLRILSLAGNHAAG